MKIVLGIAGRAEHGKTAAMNIIKEYVEVQGAGCSTHEISSYIYAYAVKHGFIQPNPRGRAGCSNADVACLVRIGNEMRRHDPMYWTKILLQAMEASSADVAICPNIRFPQEAEGIRSLGGVVIKVNRLNADGSRFISETRDPNNVTETTCDTLPADYYIADVTGQAGLYETQVRTLFDYICDVLGVFHD